VGLSAKILPHNFGEICQAAVAYLKGEDFQLFPDFQTGCSIDVSNYRDGRRGGSVKVRTTIQKIDNKTLVIRDVPYGKTTGTLKESITRANEKGQIKIRKVDENTAAEAEVIVHLAPGVSSDKTIDALYAFTDCEVSISPNCVVIDDNKPIFLSVSDVLRNSVDRTKELLQRELEIRRDELLEQLHFASLERIFIEERIYKDRQFEQAKDLDTVVAHIDSRLEPFKPQFIREVTRDDIERLLEIKMARITKFNKDKSDELMARLREEVERIEKDLQNMVRVAINWYELLYEKYAAEHPRRTEIRSFDTIVAAKVAEANQKLYINREEGFIGTSLKKDEFVENCSDIDNVIIFYRDGTYKVTRVADKVFVGETERSKREKKKAEIIHVAVFKKNDARTIYNVVYRDGKNGASFIKRFNVVSVQHDREYDLTQGKPGSRVLYFTANPNGEAETIHAVFRPSPKRKKTHIDADFSTVLVKGRAARGNKLTKEDVQRVSLKAHGQSTLGGRKVWFDHDVARLNFDEHGQYLGEFHSGEQVLVVLPNGEYYTTNFDPNNHYEPNILRIEKFDSAKVWTVALLDASQQNYLYLKRFHLEALPSHRRANILGENDESTLLALSDAPRPMLRVVFGGADAFRDPLEINAEEFIAVKSVKAKGKRVSTCNIYKVEELEPLPVPEEPVPEEPEEADEEKLSTVNRQLSTEDEYSSENAPEAETDEPNVIDEGNSIQLDLFGDFDFDK